jgi:nucleoside-diphosphate-sugar epimerase
VVNRSAVICVSAHIFKKSRVQASFKAVNEDGTASVVQAASEAGVRHFILISSVSVYGESCSGADETATCNPSGDYAASKFNAEQRSIELASASDMHLTILRLATLYGEEDPGNVGRLMRAIDRRLFLWIGDGSNKKSLLHREDAARACISAVQSTIEKINIFNVSAGEYTMREIVSRLAEALGRNVPEWSIPSSAVLSLTKAVSVFPPLKNTFTRYHGVIKKWLADDFYNATKFEKNCGFKAKVDLARGLHQEVAWYRNRKNV